MKLFISKIKKQNCDTNKASGAFGSVPVHFIRFQ